MPNICSISAGKVKQLTSPVNDGSPAISSAIHKAPISSKEQPNQVKVLQLGIEGDEQSNLQVHGGRDKAIYVYPVEHYPFWKDCLIRHNHLDRDTELMHGYFGENLTVEGFNESQVYIGDKWCVGDAIFQITDMREPCYKLNIKMNFKTAAKTMVQSGYSGWYLRVLQIGSIKAGDEIRVVAGSRQISIAAQNETFYRLKGQDELDL
jgi:MOSC domain-containing protein YiiM